MQLETPLREQHANDHAAFAVYFGCLLPERFSDFATEYEFARKTVGLLDTNFRAFFDVHGPDRARYLNAMLSNNIKDLAVGQGCASLLLNPQGHILAEVEVYALAEGLLAVSHAMARERTYTTLEKYIIMDDVTMDDITPRTASVALEGPRAGDTLRALCGIELDAMPLYAHAEAIVSGIPCRVTRRSLSGEAGAELVADRQQIAPLWRVLEAAVRAQRGGPVGYAALESLRIEAGIPWFGYDFDDQCIPHEAALESTHINYVKGCYVGQEIVERVRARGQVNRRRVGLRFSGSTIPERGTKLLVDREEVGHVTSAAHSPALGSAIGMGYVRREHNALGSALQWSGGTAEVILLPILGGGTPQED